jgi:hypothetical protein
MVRMCGGNKIRIKKKINNLRKIIIRVQQTKK